MDTPAKLIRRARKAQGVSPEQIVKRMARKKVAPRYWRQVEEGERDASEETLAHMSYTAGVAPEQLDEIGAREVAAIVREIDRQERAAESTGSELIEAALREDPELAALWADLPADRRAQLVQIGERYQRRLQEDRERAGEDLATLLRAVVAPGESAT